MWISLIEAAQIVERGYSVLWRMALTRQLRSRREGSRWLVLRADVEKLRRRLREGEGATAGAAR
jgi:hypothetical protein